MLNEKPPVNLDNPPPDPILDQMGGHSNLDVPGKGKKYLSIFIGILVLLILLGILGAILYLMKDSMAVVLDEYNNGGI